MKRQTNPSDSKPAAKRAGVKNAAVNEVVSRGSLKAGLPKAKASKATRSRSSAKSSKPSRAEAEKQFVRGVVIRGEACAPSAEGQLPDGCTHQITGQKTGEELPTIERVAFSMD